MHVDVQENRVTVRGEMAMGDPQLTVLADHLEQLAAGFSSVELDLTEVTFIDSTGLGIIVAASRATRAADHHLHVVAASDRVHALIELTHLHEVLDISTSSRPDADRSEQHPDDLTTVEAYTRRRLA